MISTESLPCRATQDLRQHQDKIARADSALDAEIEYIKSREIDLLCEDDQSFADMKLDGIHADELLTLERKIYGHKALCYVPCELIEEWFNKLTDQGDKWAQRIAERKA